MRRLLVSDSRQVPRSRSPVPIDATRIPGRRSLQTPDLEREASMPGNGSKRKDAWSARDHADRNLAEELSRRRKADGPTARAGSACDGARNVLAHEPRLKSEARGSV